MRQGFKILVVDDDPLTCRKLEFLLRKDGHSVVATTDGASAYEIMRGEEAPALVVLDVLMPGMNGVELCRRIRQIPRDIQPYIILLTIKGAKEDVVEGLEAGANDYVVKPFDRAELSARVGVGGQMLKLQSRLVERVRELEEALSRVRHLQVLLRKDTHVYEFGPFRLDAGERRLLRGGEVLPLTAKVFDLLLLLVQNGGHLLEKGEIMREVWGDREVEENNLTVSMSGLRKTLGGEGTDYIETVPKLGYRFAAEVRRIT